jgi:hypothetical protein
MGFPRLVTVRQNFPDRSLKDIPGEVGRQLKNAGFASKLKPGSRVAIGVGSRGITNLAAIVRAIVDFWKTEGMKPFLFPAMGSHGAATAEGQAQVLAHYGITETSMGCPVISQLEVVPLGKTAEGMEAFMDKEAFQADGVMLCNRVKWHTDFIGKLESGLFKMMAIGLGKFAGAQNYHVHAYKLGLENVFLSVGRQVLKSGKILGGMAILEDAYHNTAQLTAVPVESMEQCEQELLELTKSWMGKIPVPELDILIVDEIGKDISGAGMDTKVVNRSPYGHYNPWPGIPIIHRLFVRDLTAKTYGNGIGFGMADVVHDRLVAKLDWAPTMVNALTSGVTSAVRTPIHFPSDRQCLETLWPTVGKFELSQVSFGWIRNTLELTPLRLSENLMPVLRENPMLEIIGEPQPFDFDPEGNLGQVFSGASH